MIRPLFPAHTCTDHAIVASPPNPPNPAPPFPLASHPNGSVVGTKATGSATRPRAHGSYSGPVSAPIADRAAARSTDDDRMKRVWGIGMLAFAAGCGASRAAATTAAPATTGVTWDASTRPAPSCRGRPAPRRGVSRISATSSRSKRFPTQKQILRRSLKKRCWHRCGHPAKKAKPTPEPAHGVSPSSLPIRLHPRRRTRSEVGLAGTGVASQPRRYAWTACGQAVLSAGTILSVSSGRTLADSAFATRRMGCGRSRLSMAE